MTKTIEQARRKAFEAWYAQHCLESARISITEDELESMRGTHGDYADWAALHGKWIGWNAALDSLEVELPEPTPYPNEDEFEGDYEAYEYAEGHAFSMNAQLDKCREAIHAAGVKTR